MNTTLSRETPPAVYGSGTGSAGGINGLPQVAGRSPSPAARHGRDSTAFALSPAPGRGLAGLAKSVTVIVRARSSGNEAAEETKNPEKAERPRPYRQHRKPGRLCALNRLGKDLGGWWGTPSSSRAASEREAAFGNQAAALASLGHSEEGDIE